MIMIYTDVVRIQEEIFSSSLRVTTMPQALYNQSNRLNKPLINIEFALQKTRQRSADECFLTQASIA
jgi:hypothetical protein